MPQEMIFADGLTKQFNDFVAVNEICLSVAAGEVLALLGPNGAGKTTTVRMLTSILKPTRGTARVAGYDVVLEAERVRASVGVLTEHHGLYGRMNAVEYLRFFGDLYDIDPAQCKRRIDALLGEFELDFARKKRLSEYSKGMRQKLALARALLHEPPVLLLDEPTSAMDPESASIVHDAIRRLRSAERTIVLCTHNLPEAEALADQMAIIRQGKIILNGSAAELKRQLLGAPEYELRLNSPLDGRFPSLPEGVRLTQQGEDWLRLQVDEPESTNPRLLRVVLEQGLEVMALQEVPQSLERVYLQAVTQAAEEDAHVG